MRHFFFFFLPFPYPNFAKLSTDSHFLTPHHKSTHTTKQSHLQTTQPPHTAPQSNPTHTHTKSHPTTHSHTTNNYHLHHHLHHTYTIHATTPQPQLQTITIHSIKKHNNDYTSTPHTPLLYYKINPTLTTQPLLPITKLYKKYPHYIPTIHHPITTLTSPITTLHPIQTTPSHQNPIITTHINQLPPTLNTTNI